MVEPVAAEQELVLAWAKEPLRRAGAQLADYESISICTCMAAQQKEVRPILKKCKSITSRYIMFLLTMYANNFCVACQARPSP